jgi:hypothetical protein
VSGIQCPLIHRSRRLTFFSISPGTNPNQCISCSRYRNGSKVIITRRRHCNLIKLGLCFRCDLPDCDEDEWICHVIVITLYAPFLSRLVFHCYYSVRTVCQLCPLVRLRMYVLFTDWGLGYAGAPAMVTIGYYPRLTPHSVHSRPYLYR